jgi:hypothetical protein
VCDVRVIRHAGRTGTSTVISISGYLLLCARRGSLALVVGPVLIVSAGSNGNGCGGCCDSLVREVLKRMW